MECWNMATLIGFRFGRGISHFGMTDILMMHFNRIDSIVDAIHRTNERD